MNIEKLAYILNAEGYTCKAVDNSSSIRIFGIEQRLREAEKLADRIKRQIKNEKTAKEVLERPFIATENLYSHLRWRVSKKNQVFPSNEEILQRVDAENSNLILIINGLMTQPKDSVPLRRQLVKEGIQSISVNYPWKRDFEENTKYLSEEINEILRRIRKDKIILLGFSTGADLVRYMTVEDMIPPVGVVLCAPVTNGKVPDLRDYALFGNLTDYHNPKKQKGRRTLEKFTRKIKSPYVTIANLHDNFVPLASALDINGPNLIVSDYGHLESIGNNEKFNRIYLEAIKSLL
jgi:hypothetical protein